MAKKIFEYRYEIFVWCRTWIAVFDSDKENIVYFYAPYLSRENKEIKLELKKPKLEEFKNLIHNHQEIFSIWEIECNSICDWIWSEFEISDWEKTVEIHWGNLWYFDHDDDHKPLKEIRKTVEGQEVINAKILLEFFYEVRDFLVKAWVPSYCFKY